MYKFDNVKQKKNNCELNGEAVGILKNRIYTNKFWMGRSVIMFSLVNT